MGGYKNRILRVNLTDRSFSEQQLEDSLIRNYLGGRGFGAKMLWDDLKPGVDPLGPDNELAFLAGPLAATSAQSFHRFKVFFKSPLTGGYFKSSAGGHWAAELKRAGFDGIIVKGIADKPVYLWVHDGQYELRDAAHLRLLNCEDTHILIRDELHDPHIRIACTGPAGDNKVKYAGIFTDRHTAGRGGGGAVMGAKNLKAIACRGKEDVALADPAAFQEVSRQWMEMIRTSPAYRHFSTNGTQANVEVTNGLGMFPTRNFREGIMKNWQNIDGSAFKNIRVRKTACHNCMIHCVSIVKLNEGRWAGIWSEGPEYETIWGFSGPINAADIGLTVAADHLCDDLGLDTISAAVSIGMAYEMYEKGIITRNDTGGLELTYGNGEPALELVKMIAFRKGIGDLLAEGTREISRRTGRGTEHYAMHVKGLEIPAYDPRGAKAHGLSLATLAIGADHNSGYSFQELFGVRYKGQKVDRFSTQEKGEIAKYNQDFNCVHECGILCNFGGTYMQGKHEMFGKLMAAATGVKEFNDESFLWKAGERVSNLEQMFNVRDWFGRKDDYFPGRITQETLPEGPSAGKVFESDILLNDYYRARGWDNNGVPTPEKLRELGLEFTMSR